MLLCIGGVVAAGVVLIMAGIFLAASSATGRQPYAGTPTYYQSHQYARLGAVSYRSNWEQTKLTRSLELQTPDMYLKYTVEGPPDAVLQDQPFMATLAAGMVQSSWANSYQALSLNGYMRTALPSQTYEWAPDIHDYR